MNRTNIILTRLAMVALFLISAYGQAQQTDIQFFRENSKRGLNVFETSKTDTIPFDGLKVRVGGDLALQFQGIDQSNTADNLVELGTDFNLPTANLNLDVQFYDGVRMHLRTYLSSKHHPEAWVKGGYLQVDKLDFISEGFLKGFMDIATIKVGYDEFDYGDAHYRRSDNARTIFNPFVGNFIMDAFSSEPFIEVILQRNGFLGLVGVTNGKLNQSVVVDEESDNEPSFYGKLGYDKQLNEDLRLRLTGSFYTNNGTTTGAWLYGGDRAGSRYYNVLETVDEEGTDFDGRFNPRFRQLTAIQFNPFVKYRGLEFFGIYEVASNSEDEGDGSFTQLAGELLYRFGKTEQFYAGARYNIVTGEMNDTAETQEVERLNFGAGWFMTNNIMMKLEYVDQQYSGNGWTGTRFNGADFSGVVLEAAISF